MSNNDKNNTFEENTNEELDNSELSELDDDIFNMSEESDFDIFNDEEISKKEMHVVPEEERLYEDKIYEQILYDVLIQDIPLDKRADSKIDAEITNNIKKILETKNKALKSLELLKSGIEYEIINDYLENNYSKKWIIPVVSDTKVVFSKIGKDSMGNVNNDVLLSDTDLKDGFTTLNQVTQLKEWKEIQNKYSKDVITNKEYLNLLNELMLPYIENKDNHGITKHVMNTTSVLRYNNINDIYWCDRKALGTVTINNDIIDSETGEIIKTETKEFIKGEKIDIVGFFILPFGHNEVYNELGLNLGQKNISDRFGLLGKIEKISSSLPVEITVKNHGLVDNQFVYISESNSNPSIDGIYQKNIKVINKDIFTIDINKNKGVEEGNSGLLFSNLKLEYETYKLSKTKDNKINVQKTGDIDTDVKNKKYEYPKLYLFNDIKIEDKDIELYKNILKKIIPTVNDILSLEYPYLKKCNTIEDMNILLNKYSLNYNNLNSNQVDFLNKILETKPLEIQKAYNSIKDNLLYKNPNKNLFNNSLFLLSDKFINNPEIKDRYGEYILLNTNGDSMLDRIRWIFEQKDHGSLYFKLIAKEVLKEISNLKDAVKKQKEIFENELDEVNKKFTDEEKMKKFLNNDKDCVEKNYINTTSYDNNWEKALKKTGTEHEIGRKALVYKELDKKYSLFKWDGEKWVEDTEIPKYELVKYICEFKNLDLTNVDYSELNCIFKKAIGCHSKMYMKYKIKQNELEKFVNDYTKLSEYLNEPTLLNELNKSIENLSNYFTDTDLSITKKTEEIGINEFIETNKNQIIINKIVNKIRAINNINDRNYILDKLITIDGIMVGLDIYSIKYGSFMTCGHNYYAMLNSRSTDMNEKEDILNKMIDIFSDNGKSEMQNDTCKNCGEILGIRGYDDTEGFNEYGAIKKSRDLWNEETTEIVLNEIGSRVITIEEEFQSNLCGSTKFRDLLIKKGLDYNTLSITNEICDILVDLSAKSGIILLKKDVINILIDCTKILSNTLTFNEFKLKEKKKLKLSGKSLDFIEKISNDKFKKKYNSSINIEKYCTIAARLLITLQTSIPAYSRTSKDTLCTFSGFDNEIGIDYFVCLLNSIYKRDEYLLKNNKEDIFRKMFLKYLNEFKKIKGIDELYYLKKKYDTKKTEILNDINFDKIHIFKNYNKIEKNIINEIKNKNETHEDIVKSINKITSRLYNISQDIKKNIDIVIKKSPLVDVITKTSENACCLEDVTKFNGYYGYISEVLENKNIYDLFYESKYLNKYLQDFVKIGVVTRLYLTENKDLSINNMPICSGELTDNNNIIKNKFINYVNDGKYKGEIRNYIGNKLNKDEYIDLKSGKSMTDIENHEYSSKEFIELLDSIAEKNFKLTKEFNDIFKDKSNLLDNLNKEMEAQLYDKINKLVNKLSLICKKENDKDFFNRYTNLFVNIGNKSNVKKYNLSDNELKTLSVYERVQLEREIKYNKIEQIKNFYLNYIIKNIYKIKTQTFSKDYELNFIESDKLMNDIQELIFKDNEKLNSFKGDKFKLVFEKINIEYFSELISNLYGQKDKWSCTFTTVVEYSKYNMDTIFKIILYMLILQLNKVFDTLSLSDISSSITKNEANHMFSKFIIDMLDNFEKNEKIYDISDNELSKIDNIKREELRLKAIKLEEDMKGMPIEYYFLRKGTTAYTDDINENDNILTDKDEIEKKHNELRENIMEKGMQTLLNKFGREPTADELDEFTNEYINSEFIDSQETLDQFNLIKPKEGLNVIDYGGDYGDLPQGIEDEGDGIPENIEDDEFRPF